MAYSEKPQKVAAYCRVSTDRDDQANSLASQKKYFREYIERNPFWTLTEVYVDEGITGTSTKKRHAFNRMMADAQNHDFDLIVTKEISRFARNTLDSIIYTRNLKKLGIGVVFMNDNINTLDADAELRLTIMASIAQEESRKTSDRVKWGQKRRMEQGVVFGRDMLGYDVRDGKLHINKDGAEVVRLIFHKFVNEGKGTSIIARELRESGVKTSLYMKQWSNTVILRVLRNEKYCGDLIQKKTFTPDYLSHEKKQNRGEESFIVLRGHHEPIISREVFEQAQAELIRRAPSVKTKAKYSNRYCFSGKIKCGVCGRSYVSSAKKRNDNSIYKTWRCLEKARHGATHIDGTGTQTGCSATPLNDDDAKWMMQYITSNLNIDIPKVIENLTETLIGLLNPDSQGERLALLQSQTANISDKKRRLLELYMDKSITKQDFQSTNAKYDTEISGLQKEIEACRSQGQVRQNQDALLPEITSTLHNISTGKEWNDIFYRRLLDKITVYDDSRIDIYLNLLPSKWQFARTGSSRRNFGASVPVSVSVWNHSQTRFTCARDGFCLLGVVFKARYINRQGRQPESCRPCIMPKIFQTLSYM